MNEELKTCPFCGVVENVIRRRTDKEANFSFWHVCPGTYNIFTTADEFKTKQEAIKAWNTRANDWVSVEDRLPEIDQYVLWCHKSGAYYVEARDKDDYMETYEDVTHWQLITPPKDK